MPKFFKSGSPFGINPTRILTRSIFKVMKKTLRFFLASLIFMVGVLFGVAFDTFICKMPTAAYYIIGLVASAAFSLTTEDRE